MSLTLPLVHRPGSILFLDDDTDYLEMLGMVIPAHIQVELFSRPAGFARRMAQEPERWEADAQRQLQMIDRWRNGHPLLPQILRYWSGQPERHRLVQSCVVDYAMPGTDGLAVLNTLLDWPGSRVLLTGQADEQIAVKAFNSGLIDQFVPKQTTDITRHLLGVLHAFGDDAQAFHRLLHPTGEWAALVCSTGNYAEGFPEEGRKRAMKWLKMHAQYDDAHPWEALEIICTLAGMNPSKALQAELRQAVCKSYDYMYLFLERCMQLETSERLLVNRERRAVVES